MGTRSLFILGALASVIALARPASAGQPVDPPKKDSATPEADALFVQGRNLFDAKHFPEACAKLAESQRISPTVKALGMLAACHEELGKIATAWKEYRETADRARALGDPREAFARKQADALKAALPTLHLEIKRWDAELSITQNGEAIPADQAGEFFVDPGPVEVVARAPGKKEWRTRVEAAKGVRITVNVPELEPDLKTIGGKPAETPTARIAGFVVGGVGLASIAVGSGLGIVAINTNKESMKDGACDENSHCNQEGAMLRNEARSTANLSTAAFAVGAAGVAAGVILLVVSRGASKPAAPSARAIHLAPSADSRGGGLILTGSF